MRASSGCSIVIPVFNKAQLTRSCLDTLFERDGLGPDTEIVVVDDGSQDKTPAVLEHYGDRIQIVRHDHNAGFASACNDGAAATSSEFVLFLNNDTLPQPGWLDALRSYAAEHERAAVVGAKLLYANQTIQHAGMVVGQDLAPHHIYAGFPAHHPAVNKSRRFQFVTAACALVRRSAFEQVGGFDSAFHNSYEDVDLCLRLGELGHESHYCHESVLYHYETATRTHEGDARNHERFLERWGDKVERDDLRYYFEDGLLSLTYWEQYPLLLAVSPLLAALHEERDRQSERLLRLRARQAWNLLQENNRLRIKLVEAGAEPEPPSPAE